jgi:predicted branched-subunit amino acid permease
MPPSPSRAFVQGVTASMPVWIAIAPFGLIFGAVAMATGLDIVQTMGMTIIVAAGASQLAALQLMAEDAPALLAIITGAVINLRMAMYSAALAAQWPDAPLRLRALAAFFLHDQSFALSIRRYGDRPDEPVPAKVAFFLGAGISTILLWFGATFVGALFGAQVPASWGLEFAVPITFIAITAPLLRTLPHAVAASLSALLAVLGAGLPGGLGLMLATAGGIAVGLLTEKALAR